MSKPYVIVIYFNGEYVRSIPYSRRALKALRREYIATVKKKRSVYEQPSLFFSKKMEIIFDIKKKR